MTNDDDDKRREAVPAELAKIPEGALRRGLITACRADA
jgi:hypothetical protein